MIATFALVFQGGALDRAAARNLERGGHAMLNTNIMASGRLQIGLALRTCLEESAKGPVIFHCQKGKDRTGVLGMLVQSIMRSTDEEIIRAYALSGELLGEGNSDAKDKVDDDDGRSKSGLVDWSFFRGSPGEAMVETLEFTRQRYGSIEAYLEDAASFDVSQQRRFREQLSSLEREIESGA